MAETTKAQSGDMAKVAADFDDVNSQLHTMLSRLMNELSELNSGWKGLGAVAFENVKQQYAEDLKRLNTALAQTADSIRASGTSYDSTDTDAASRLSNSGGTVSLPL